MSLVFACPSCGSPSIALPEILDDEAVVHCGRCAAEVGRWGPFKALARRPDGAGARPAGRDGAGAAAPSASRDAVNSLGR